MNQSYDNCGLSRTHRALVSRQTEIKLAVENGCKPTCWTRRVNGAGQASNYETIYFDTDNLDLRRHQLELYVRNRDRERARDRARGHDRQKTAKLSEKLQPKDAVSVPLIGWWKDFGKCPVFLAAGIPEREIYSACRRNAQETTLYSSNGRATLGCLHDSANRGRMVSGSNAYEVGKNSQKIGFGRQGRHRPEHLPFPTSWKQRSLFLPPWRLSG